MPHIITLAAGCLWLWYLDGTEYAYAVMLGGFALDSLAWTVILARQPPPGTLPQSPH